ncbi:MAG TPA: diaminopimelate decarboxylase [Candidatus Avirikenella pullistercoris]|nr:diaminopimelate decarboxylase [Candidatus Avirikenella pullistercoris]
MLNETFVQKIKNIKTPFYYYDMELLHTTLKKLTEESGKYGFHVHYALKANFDPRLLQEIRQYDLGVDCVSGNEVRCAIEAGFPAEKIVFAGVGKSDDEIIYALEQNIFSFNCESREELEVINSLAAQRNKTARIALRINPDVDPHTHQHISTGKADNKFGISYTEIDEVLAQLQTLNNINITGIHFHIGSQISQMKVFEYLCKRVNTIAEWFEEKGLNLSHINVGGGLSINYENPDANPVSNFKEYFEIFAQNLHLRPGQTLHFELGRSVVGQCGTLISRVLYNKTTGSGKRFIIIDASMTELIRPALYQAHHAIVNLSSDQGAITYNVAGGVCESTDVFAKDIVLPETKRGDIIAIKSAGAYGSSMASRYNLRNLPASVYSDKL